MQVLLNWKLGILLGLVKLLLLVGIPEVVRFIGLPILLGENETADKQRNMK